MRLLVGPQKAQAVTRVAERELGPTATAGCGRSVRVEQHHSKLGAGESGDGEARLALARDRHRQALLLRSGWRALGGVERADGKQQGSMDAQREA